MYIRKSRTRWCLDKVQQMHSRSGESLTQPGAQATILGAEFLNQDSYDHEICSDDEGGTDDSCRDSGLQM